MSDDLGISDFYDVKPATPGAVRRLLSTAMLDLRNGLLLATRTKEGLAIACAAGIVLTEGERRLLVQFAHGEPVVSQAERARLQDEVAELEDEVLRLTECLVAAEARAAKALGAL